MLPAADRFPVTQISESALRACRWRWPALRLGQLGAVGPDLFEGLDILGDQLRRCRAWIGGSFGGWFHRLASE